MVQRCVAAGCSYTHKDGFSLFRFPKDPKLRKQWADQVRRTRDKWLGPSEHSVLCSGHFDVSCFEAKAKISESLGLSGKHRLRLKPDAVPTLFRRPSASSKDQSFTEPPPTKKRRGAYEKRERRRRVEEALAEVEVSTGDTLRGADVNTCTETLPWVEEALAEVEGTTRDTLRGTDADTEKLPSGSSQADTETLPCGSPQSDTETFPSGSAQVNVQVPVIPVDLEPYQKTKTKGVQVESTCYKDHGIQCSLIPAPLLKKFTISSRTSDI